MKRPRKPPPGAAPLRRRAEARLKKPAPAKAPPRTGADPQRLLHDLQVRQVGLETRNEELRRALAETRAALKEEQARIRSYLDVAEAMIVVIEAGQRTALVNRKTCEVLGYEEAELVGRNWFDTVLPEAGRDRIKGGFEDLIAGRVEPWKYVESPARMKRGEERLIAWHNTVLRDASGAIVATLSSGEDVTERKRAENRERLTRNVLELLSRANDTVNAIRDILCLIQKSQDWEAVGIRLQEGDDFPYYKTSGFSEEFVCAERYLCERDAAGKPVRDSRGNPVLECMCGNILRGRFNTSLPFFTAGGSFWTNSTTDLLASTTEKDRPGRTRNRCNSEGYESVALIPLRSGAEIIGLLQLNDRRRGRFTPEMIRFFEGLGASIGIALARKRAEEEVRILARFPSENSDPVLRVARDGTLLYVNDAGVSLLTEWHLQAGRSVPSVLQAVVFEALNCGSRRLIDLEHGTRTFSFSVAPIAEAGYANLYGRDVTESRRSEATLRANETRFLSLFENMINGFAYCRMIFEQDRPRDFVYLTVNAAFETLTGLKNVVGRNVSEVIPGIRESDPGLFEIYGRVVRTGVPEQVEVFVEALKMWLAISVYRPARDHFVAIFDVITERKQAEAHLRRSQEQTHALAARLQSIREEERAGIAREIHDELGQTLTAAKMDVSWLQRHLPAADPPAVDPLRKKTEALLALIDTQIRTVQRIASDLRPGLLDDLGLVSTLRWYAGQFRERTGLRVDLDLPPEDVALEAARATAAFRICQEALTNVARHARAAAVSVRLRATPERLTLEVRDDGRGITPLETQSPKSLGLLGMRERVLPWGGTVDVRGEPGKGTTVTVTIPLA